MESHAAILVVNTLIAASVAYVGYQQYNTNKRQVKINYDKLRLDLYNIRFEIYSTALDFYCALIEYDASLDKGDFHLLHKRFIKMSQESQFMFKPESGIYGLLSEMHKKSFDRTGFIKHSRELRPTDPDTAAVFLSSYQKSEAVLKFSDDTILTLRKAMAPYLNFHEILGGDPQAPTEAHKEL